MAHCRLKLCVLVLGVCWCVILVYVMSSLHWGPGDMSDMNRHSQDVKDSRIAKSLVMLKGVIAMARGNTTVAPLATPANPPRHANQPRHTKPPHNQTHRSDGAAVNVVISGDESSLVGLVTVINSVVSNALAKTHFYVALPKHVIPDFVKWINKSKLENIEYTVRGQPAEVPPGRPHFTKLFLLTLFPELEGRVVYLATDVIVQGNIEELANIPLDPSQFGAFPEDCTALSKRFNLARPRYATHVNLHHPKLKGLKIRPMACTFNTDVFVADVARWREGNVTRLMQELVDSHSKSSPISGQEAEVDEAEAAMLIVFYQRTQAIPPLWHVGDLGVSTGAAYSQDFVSKAKLLHWNGHFKPWVRRSGYSSVWLKYYIPDPDKKYKAILRYA